MWCDVVLAFLVVWVRFVLVGLSEPKVIGDLNL